ncbi:MAG: SRSO17 transposase [Verrucomicrobiales bacterium]|jgi:SRSO17 transposase
MTLKLLTPIWIKPWIGSADFIEGFGSRFDNVNRQTLDSIASYIHGLLSEAHRKNIERIAEQKPTSHYQNIQYAVSEARWDHRQIINGVAQQANRFFQGNCSGRLLKNLAWHQRISRNG